MWLWNFAHGLRPFHIHTYDLLLLVLLVILIIVAIICKRKYKNRDKDNEKELEELQAAAGGIPSAEATAENGPEQAEEKGGSAV